MVHIFVWLGNGGSSLFLGRLLLEAQSQRTSAVWYVQNPDNYSPKQTIAGKKFRNEKVVLDAMRYINCEFKNVSLIYNGTTPIQFERNTMAGFWLRSDNEAIQNAWALLKGIGMLRDDMQINVTHPTSFVVPAEYILTKPADDKTPPSGSGVELKSPESPEPTKS